MQQSVWPIREKSDKNIISISGSFVNTPKKSSPVQKKAHPELGVPLNYSGSVPLARVRMLRARGSMEAMAWSQVFPAVPTSTRIAPGSKS